jgi:hypothetical protein
MHADLDDLGGTMHAGSVVQVAHANGAQGVAHAWSCTRDGAKGSNPGKAPRVVSKPWRVLVLRHGGWVGKYRGAGGQGTHLVVGLLLML